MRGRARLGGHALGGQHDGVFGEADCELALLQRALGRMRAASLSKALGRWAALARPRI